VGRSVRESVRSRRDVREEDQVSAGRRSRPLMLLAAAAAAVVLIGGGGAAYLLNSGKDSAGSGVDQFPGGAKPQIVRSSGRDYTASTLVAQVRALLAGTPAPTPSGKSGTATAKSSTAAPASTAGTVADPQQLQSCLVGLGEPDRTPLVVDLARYQGQNAAVIVLPRPTGGYDIWVVTRQCKAGSERPLAFKTVPK
jgi:hypothetical protein